MNELLILVKQFINQLVFWVMVSPWEQALRVRCGRTVGELVLDPFGGLGTVAYCAVLRGRRGYSIELNAQYWKDSVAYCKAAEQKVSMPTLFDLIDSEETNEVPA